MAGSFVLDLSRFADKAKGRLDTVVRKIVLDLGERIVLRSPVGDPSIWQSPPPPGYVGGRFRANWQYGYGAMPDGEASAPDPRGDATQARIRAGVMGAPAAGVHYIVNNLPYAERIEDGWSTQAPAGVVGLAVVEFDGVVRSAAQ